MGTACYSMVRGSVIRITRLDNRGGVLAGDRSSLVSRNVAKVTLNEVSDSRAELNEKDDRNKIRLYAPAQAQTVRFQADIDFTLTDPDAIELTTGQPVVLNANGDAVGWDAKTRVRTVPFALEVWSRLDDRSTGYQYGYTVFPYLRGGFLSGMTFGDGHISFGIKGARTMKGTRWGAGPYDLNVPAWDITSWDGQDWDGVGCVPNINGWDTAGWDTDSWGGSLPSDGPRPHTLRKNTMWSNFLVDSAPEPSCGATAIPGTSGFGGGGFGLTPFGS